MDSFTIKTCSIADGPAITRNNVVAFWTDRTWVQIWQGRTREYVAEQAARRGRSNLLMDRAHRRHLVAVEKATGGVIGYARWVLPCAGGGGDGKEEEDPCNGLWPEARIPDVDAVVRSEAERESQTADWTFGAGPMDGLDDPITAMGERLRTGKKYMELDYLCVPPEFRRRGIASALIRSGLEEAEWLGLDTFVLAMKAGVSVYLKAGFVLLDHVFVDASHVGGDRDYGGWFLERRVEHDAKSVKDLAS